jgi:hypothetical protein
LDFCPKSNLTQDGKIYVTPMDSPYYRGWHIEEQAAEHGFKVFGTQKLSYEELISVYPGYGHRQTGSDLSAFPQDRPTITYIFQGKEN